MISADSAVYAARCPIPDVVPPSERGACVRPFSRDFVSCGPGFIGARRLPICGLSTGSFRAR